MEPLSDESDSLEDLEEYPDALDLGETSLAVKSGLSADFLLAVITVVDALLLVDAIDDASSDVEAAEPSDSSSRSESALLSVSPSLLDRDDLLECCIEIPADRSSSVSLSSSSEEEVEDSLSDSTSPPATEPVALLSLEVAESLSVVSSPDESFPMALTLSVCVRCGERFEILFKCNDAKAVPFGELMDKLL